MLKIVIDNYIRFKFDWLEKYHSGVLESLVKRFTYDNPKYLENEKWGYSNHNVNRYLFSYKMDNERSVICFSRGCKKYILNFLVSRNVPFEIVDRTLTLPSVDFEFSKVVLRSDQIPFVEACIKGKSGIGLGSTSFGKTLSGLEIIRKVKQPALIVVHTEFLQKQWFKEATNKNLFNMPEELIGGCGGIFRNSPRVGLLNICLYHSLSDNKYLQMFKDKVGIVITDECQKASISDVHKVLNSFPCVYRLGISANFRRKDKTEFLIEDTLGEVLYKAEEQNNGSKILSHIHLVPTDYIDYEYAMDNNYSAFITRAALDKHRNLFILRRVTRQLKQGKQVMILVERKEQACILYSALSKKGIKTALLMGPVNKKDISSFTSNTAKHVALNYDDKKAYDYVKKYAELKELDVVIGTQKAEVGLSVRTLNHLIITTPVGSNVEDRLNQMIGRVERTHGELESKFGVKPIPTVDILIDVNVGNFKRHIKYIKDFYGKRCFLVKN